MVTEYQRHIPCVIPCGGSSTRLGTGESKCLAGTIPPIVHVIDFWKSKGITNFIFIVGGEHMCETIKVVRQAVPDAFIVDRGKVVNLAKAILMVSDAILDRFILALGDCLNFGDFIAPWDVDFGVGVCLTDLTELRKNYLVSLNNHSVARLVEKPTKDIGLCGMGTFFLHRRIFDYIHRLRLPDEATSVDLTGALQLAIGSGEEVYPIYFKGTYINVTYPQDVKQAEEMNNVSTCRPRCNC